jgi:hypothetical protein
MGRPSKLNEQVRSLVLNNVGPDGRAIIPWGRYAEQTGQHYTQIRRWRNALIAAGKLTDASRYAGSYNTGSNPKKSNLPPDLRPVPKSTELHYDALISKLAEMVEKSSDATAVRALQLLLEEKRATQSGSGPPPPSSETELHARLVQILRHVPQNIATKAMNEAYNVQKAPENPPPAPQAAPEDPGIPPS